jgi:hypothetical protein
VTASQPDLQPGVQIAFPALSAEPGELVGARYAHETVSSIEDLVLPATGTEGRPRTGACTYL